MPIVNIQTMKGALNKEKKALLHKKIADILVEIEGNGNEALRPYVIITIIEEEPENFSIGGSHASLEFIKKMTG